MVMKAKKSLTQRYFSSMNIRLKLFPSIALIGCAAFSIPASAGFVDFTDKDEWIAAVGDFTTIDFTGFPLGTFITDQYADLGIIFTDGNDSIHQTCSFVNDCWGLDGNGDISVTFDTPQLWIGTDFPGFLAIELYSNGNLIHTGFFGFGGVGNFGGILSSVPFDAAVLIDVGDEAAIDDLHFGVPTPGSLTILVLGCLFQRRRRQ